MREPSATDFPLDVPGIGSFIFARRTKRDRFKISTEYQRLTGGIADLQSDLSLIADATATLINQMVECPDGFEKLLDLNAIVDDDESTDNDEKLLTVFFALRQKELSFRPGADKAGKAASPGNDSDGGVLVPDEVQPAAE